MSKKEFEEIYEAGALAAAVKVGEQLDIRKPDVRHEYFNRILRAMNDARSPDQLGIRAFIDPGEDVDPTETLEKSPKEFVVGMVTRDLEKKVVTKRVFKFKSPEKKTEAAASDGPGGDGGDDSQGDGEADGAGENQAGGDVQ